ncbi:MAG: peptidyl-prolyl cis-trans isomerase [candidate division WOR-3 bacterium]
MLETYRFIAVAAVILLGFGCTERQLGRAVVARVNGKPILASELAEVLPARPDSGNSWDSVRRRALDDLVTRELFVQEAERRGIGDSIAYQLELDRKRLVTQELYNAVVAKGNQVSEVELAAAYRLLANEVHVQLISVASESLATRIVAELATGVPFETLAVRYSEDRIAAAGGDIGYVPELAFDEPLRSAVLALSPGEWTKPVKVGEGYQLVRLVERRPADPAPPPYGELKQELLFRLKQQKRRQLAEAYLAQVRARLTYNPRGLDIMCKPVDSITAEEQEEWVAIKDNSKYVKVGRLLHIARRFPASLDTTMRKYTIRREIQDDVLYEDGLTRGFDRLASVKRQLDDRRRDLLYQALYKREVIDRTQVTDDDVRRYYEEHRSSYPGQDADAAAPAIRLALFAERRDQRFAQFRDELRSRARIEIVEAALAGVEPGQAGRKKGAK